MQRWKSAILLLSSGLVMTLCGPQVLFAAGPITSNDYRIDFVTGPVLGSSRYVALGGAATALAADVDGVAWNMASFASRTLYELDWFEYGLSLSVFTPGLFGQGDLFNNGASGGIGIEVDDFFHTTVGLRLQFGGFGVGTLFQSYSFDMSQGGVPLTTAFTQGWLGAAQAFVQGQFIVGLGLRIMGMSMSSQGSTLADLSGASLEAGLIVRPEAWPLRLGLTVRMPVESGSVETSELQPVAGLYSVRGFVLPSGVYKPWELAVGAAWQLGKRPLNRRFEPPEDPEPILRSTMEGERCRRMEAQVNRERAARGDSFFDRSMCPAVFEQPSDARWWEQEDRRRQQEDETLEARIEAEKLAIEKNRQERYDQLSRSYLLLSADVLLTGKTSKGIPPDAFLAQEMRPAGRHVTTSIRLGAETEPWKGRMKTRLGSYLEPSRVQALSWRPHVTGGFDFRLFRWDLFGWLDPFDLRAGIAADYAPRYFDAGFSIGVWH